MARVLIVGGGARGRRLASALVAQGHALRITTRSESRRAAIERCGAECFIGDPDRLATLGASLEHVTVACWMLACASGPPAQLRALHSSRLELFLERMIDTTVRGFVYEAAGATVPEAVLADGATITLAVTGRNAIPACVLKADPATEESWLADARAAVGALIDGC